MSSTPKTQIKPLLFARLAALRAFIAARRLRVRGFGLLLFYCHMLMVFAFLGRLYLPDLEDLARALGSGQAWRLEAVKRLESLREEAINGLNTAKAEAGQLQEALRAPGSLRQARDQAAEVSRILKDSESASRVRSWLAADPAESEPEAGQEAPKSRAVIAPDGEAGTASAATESELAAFRLPELAELSGLPLSAKISSALVPLLFMLTTLSLFFSFFFRVAVWLGWGHIILSAVLLIRAGLALQDAPPCTWPACRKACRTSPAAASSSGCAVWAPWPCCWALP